MLVEGVSDAALLREFAWAWADKGVGRQAFVDALSIIAIGNRIGQWPAQLLATRGAELCSKLALLADSDTAPGEAPTAPTWLGDHDDSIVRVFFSEPTLEPAVTLGNEQLVIASLKAMNLEAPDELDAEWVRQFFRSRRAERKAQPATASRPAVEARTAITAGPGSSRKAEFALTLAEHIREALDRKEEIAVPTAMADVLGFLAPAPTDPGLSGPSDDKPESEGLPSRRTETTSNDSLDGEPAG